MSTEQKTRSKQRDEFQPPASGGRKKSRNWLVACVLVIAGGGYFYWQQNADEGPQNEPLIVTVAMGSIENSVAAGGSLQPSSFVDVGVQVSGQLEKLYVEVGDLVKRGQLLAEIDARVQENRVKASRASIEALEAQIAARQASLKLAEANAARQERLMAEIATSQLDYDTAITSLASARSSLIQLQAQIMQSRASLASDETTLEFSKIYAPSSGTVVSIEMNEGRTLNATQQAPTILRIADLSIMTVETAISEADIGNLTQGMRVYFTTLGGGNRRWYGTLRQILPTPVIENNVVLYTGLFDVDNRDGALLTAMTTQVYFITSSAENVVTVPVGALIFADAPGPEDIAARIAARQAAGGGSPGGFGGASGRGGPPGGFGGAGGQRPGEGGPPGGFGGAGGQRPGGGAFPGGFGGRQGAAITNTGRRLATVQLVNEDGSMEEREIIIGVTSRIAAQVISGLHVGDRVVAGIIQGNVDESVGNNNNNRDAFRMMRGFR